MQEFTSRFFGGNIQQLERQTHRKSNEPQPVF